jgi:glutamine---fructose-6-phosphate transaminase (isomerizing)
MSSIFGILNDKNELVSKQQELLRLEKASVDMINVATVVNGRIEWQEVEELSTVVSELSLRGNFGIAYKHQPNESDHLHLYANERLAIVYNGEIENNIELREELISFGYEFQSRNDNELLLQFINRYLDIGLSPKEAISISIMRLQGNFIIMALFAQKEEQIIIARREHPLAIGLGQDILYMAQDTNLLKPLSQQVIELSEVCPSILSSVKMPDTTSKASLKK